MFVFVIWWLSLYVIWKFYPVIIRKFPKLFTLCGGLPRRGSSKSFGVFTYGGYYISYETCRFNKWFLNLFHQRSPFVQTCMIYWFNIGAVVTVVGQLVIPFVLFGMLTRQLQDIASKHNDPSSSSIAHKQDLITSALTTPLVPGINMSTSEMLLLWLCTVIVLVIHECGHALAAATAQLEISGLGGFFSLIYPGAYVMLDDSVKYLPLRLQFRIYSAGIWHNLCCLLVVQGLLTHYSSITAFTHTRSDYGPVVSYVQSTYAPPAVLTPLLPTAISAGMTAMAKYSFASGSIFEGILRPGDSINAVNGVSVCTREDLFAYLIAMESDIHHYNTLDAGALARGDGSAAARWHGESHSRFNIGSPFTLRNQTLESIRLTHSNKESLQSCCRQHFQVSGALGGLEGGAAAGLGECFVQERVDADVEALFSREDGSAAASAGGDGSSPVRRGNLRRRRYGVGSPSRRDLGHAQTAKRHFNYYCLPTSAVYSLGLAHWVPLGGVDDHTLLERRLGAGRDEDGDALMVLQPVTAAPLQVFMIEVSPWLGRHTPGNQETDSRTEVLVVETTPHHFVKSVGFVNYVPRPFFDAHSSPHKPAKHNYHQSQHIRTEAHGGNFARLRLAEEAIVAEEEGDPYHSLNLYLYNTLVFNSIIRWPELLYRIIWWSLQVTALLHPRLRLSPAACHVCIELFCIESCTVASYFRCSVQSCTASVYRWETDLRLSLQTDRARVSMIVYSGLVLCFVRFSPHNALHSEYVLACTCRYWAVVSRTISYCCCVLVALLLVATTFPVLFRFHPV